MLRFQLNIIDSRLLGTKYAVGSTQWGNNFQFVGSLRVVFVPTRTGAEVVQVNAYYPFGAPTAALGFNNPNYNNRYLREGKEYISDHSWNKYDFEARAFCSWTGGNLTHSSLLTPHSKIFSTY
ncbi:MAG: hypothetical protein LBH91_00940 [Prevotellaceae bacterium]|nr:hypothetical protein [Prevotellaceae bacterium]